MPEKDDTGVKLKRKPVPVIGVTPSIQSYLKTLRRDMNSLTGDKLSTFDAVLLMEMLADVATGMQTGTLKYTFQISSMAAVELADKLVENYLRERMSDHFDEATIDKAITNFQMIFKGQYICLEVE